MSDAAGQPVFEVPAAIAEYIGAEAIGIAAERVRSLRRLFIPHARFSAELEELVAHHMLFDPRPGAEGSVLMFTGMTGAGKSKTLQYYARQFPPVETETGTRRRVLYVRLPPGADRYSLQRRIMAELGIPIPPKRSSDEISLDIAYHLAMQGVELLILDESNHLVDKKTDKTQFLAADVIKELLNFGCSQVVFAGLESALQIIEVNMQLHRRVTSNFHVDPYRWTDDSEREAFQNFLLTVADEITWFTHRPALEDDAFAERMHRAAYGAVGTVMVLVQKAVEIATRMDAPRLMDDHFAAAFDILKPAGTTGNAFSGEGGVSFPWEREKERKKSRFVDDDGKSPVRRLKAGA